MVTQKNKKKFRKTKKQMGLKTDSLKTNSLKTNSLKTDSLKTNSLKTDSLKHPLNPFIKSHKGDKYFLVFSSKNNHLINLDNIFIKCFIEKMLEILKFSFNREKEYHIKLGNYPSGYQHSISNIIMKLQSSNYITTVATDELLTPISFLHIEQKEDDYDKMWTVCTDQQKRGNGFSSFVIQNTIKEEIKRKRKRLLLEIYNDDVIERIGDEPRQNDIMNHFTKQGFRETSRDELTPFTISNLLSSSGETKIMTYKF